MERGSGILLHISSLPSPYGIGTLGKAAYRFADFLERTGQKYWQILPMSPTGFGDSPYQSCSSYAGNPYFIDLDMLSLSGNLQPCVYKDIDWGNSAERVDYEKIYNSRFEVLKAAFLADRDELREKLEDFKKSEGRWLEDYALYMAVKRENNLRPYWEWDEELIKKQPHAIAAAKDRLSDEIEFFVYIQYRFFEQWRRLKEYINSKGIKIIGDIPIYVAEDSADAWLCGEVLQLGGNGRPARVAGCPPDYFSPKGQLWGNPLYDWEYLKNTGYKWWIDRIGFQLKMYDIVRIDHFRGFSAYWSIEFGDEDATGGRWVMVPGKELFDALKARFGDKLPIIAENLGFIDKEVEELIKYTGFPGMKVLQFAFDPTGASDYLPHKFEKNCIAYIGTHDNDTLLGWHAGESGEVRSFADEYMRVGSDISDGFITGIEASVADVVILTLQDVLKLSGTARMNTPATLGGNWQWRLNRIEDLNICEKRLARITRLYGR